MDIQWHPQIFQMKYLFKISGMVSSIVIQKPRAVSVTSWDILRKKYHYKFIHIQRFLNPFMTLIPLDINIQSWCIKWYSMISIFIHRSSCCCSVCTAYLSSHFVILPYHRFLLSFPTRYSRLSFNRRYPTVSMEIFRVRDKSSE